MEKSCSCCKSNVIEIKLKDNFNNDYLLKCKVCNHIQVSNTPSRELLKEYYNTNYSLTRSKIFDDIYKTTMEMRSISQRKYISKFISNHIHSMLDIGCGYGFLAEEMAKFGIKVKGYDFDLNAIEYASNNKVNAIHLNSEYDLYKLELVDLITMSHSLEHMFNPYELIKKFKNISNYIFIEVPYYSTKYTFQWKNQQGHLNFYNKESLEALLNNLGCSIIDIHRYGPSMHYYWNYPLKCLRKMAEILRINKKTDYFDRQYSLNEHGIWIRAIVSTDKA